MSSTPIATTSNLAIKAWSRKAWSDAVKNTMFGKLVGKSNRAIVQVKDELKKDNGDRIRFSLRSLPTGLGVQDDETLEGNEEGLDFKTFDMYLGEKRHAFQVDLNLSNQRTMFDVRQEAKDALQEWIEEYLDRTFFEVLSGAGTGPAGVSFYHRSGMLGGNTLLAPSTDRIVYGGTGVTTKAGIAATDVMSFAVLDKVAEQLKLASPTMRKANFGGKKKWVCILHPWQVNDLRSDTSAGEWFDVQRAKMEAGMVKNNPIFSEALGEYRDMILVESTRIPTFTDYGAGANISAARALVLGAQAATVAHAKGTDKWGKMKLVEKTKDFDKFYAVSATLLWGIAKARFQDQSDFGVFAVDTAAAAHA